MMHNFFKITFHKFFWSLLSLNLSKGLAAKLVKLPVLWTILKEAVYEVAGILKTKLL